MNTILASMCAMIMTLCSNFGAFACTITGVMATESSSIDMNVVTMILDVVKAILGLFSVFPLNVFLIASIIGIAFGVFRKAKHS